MNSENMSAPLKAALAAFLVCATLLCSCGGEESAVLSSENETAEQSAESAETTAKTGFGLYIDGHFIAACDSIDTVNASLENATALLALSYGMPASDTTLRNEVRVIESLYDGECFADIDGLDSMLGAHGSGVFTDYTGAEIGITPVVITQSTMQKESVIKAETEYRETDLLEIGETVTVYEGTDGTAVDTYSFVAQNGVVLESELVDTQVMLAAVPGEAWVGSSSGATLMAADEKLFLPYDGRVSSWYGPRVLSGSSGFHTGIDLIAHSGKCYGDPIRAAEDGVVSFAGDRGGYGKLVVISHSQRMETYYGHCSELLVEEDQTVKRGDVIGLIGTTGRVTGPHLHFEVQINGNDVNPKSYLDWDSYEK